MKNPCPGLWLADIQEQTKHLTSLTNNLITLSRMEEERTRLQMIDFKWKRNGTVFSGTCPHTEQDFWNLDPADDLPVRRWKIAHTAGIDPVG